MFFLLISHILSISCKHSVDVENKPMRYTFDVDEGELICINSSLPFLTVVFHNSIVKATYYLQANLNSMSESGNFLFPSENGGISFGAKKGSIDVMALLPGNVSFSVFSFPPVCLGRYVTTKQTNEIVLKDVFGPFQKGHYCIWYPQSSFTVTGSEAPEAPDSVSICEKSSDCDDPFSDRQLSASVKNPSFFKINAHTIDFYKHFQLDLISQSKRPLIPFDMSSVIDISQTTLFEITSPKKFKKEDSDKDKLDDEEEDDEKNVRKEDEKEEEGQQDQDDNNHNFNKNNNNKQKRIEIPPMHDNRRSSRKEISTGEIMAMVTVICAIIVTFVSCFLCGGTNSICKHLKMYQGRQRLVEDEHRQSETRLLGNQQGQQPVMVTMMPVYSNQNQQMPLTGVYFPPVTSEDAANIPQLANQNNNQNIQPQPLLILPNPPQNSNNQQSQQNQQPQYFYSQQGFYPQYAIVQPPQGFGNQQVQNPVNSNTNATTPTNE